MAWNPSPKVADCREIARKWGNGIEQVIIIGIDGAGRTTTATYGRTVQLCACADAFGKAAIKGIHRHIEDTETPAGPSQDYPPKAPKGGSGSSAHAGPQDLPGQPTP